MKRTLTLILTLILTLNLAACASAPAAEPTAEPAPTAEVQTDAEPSAEAGEDAEQLVRVMVLNGTTGFGMAKFIADEAEGRTARTFDFSVETDASAVTAALVSGSCDIAALPTNAAAALSAKTDGGVRLLALNTLGVLYLVVNSETTSVQSLEDLAGMTVYVPAQNPTFIVQALCGKAGVDVTLDDTYAQPADLCTALASGQVDVAVLPEPMVTIACAKNDKLAVALDLTEQWDALFPAGSLVQGCVVARAAFVDAHPELTAAFLERYGASIRYLTDQPEDAADLIVQAGIFTDAAVALAAIPNCNVCFITGKEMKTDMEEYLSILFDVAPAAVGGALPGDSFYYGAD